MTRDHYLHAILKAINDGFYGMAFALEIIMEREFPSAK